MRNSGAAIRNPGRYDKERVQPMGDSQALRLKESTMKLVIGAALGAAVGFGIYLLNSGAGGG